MKDPALKNNDKKKNGAQKAAHHHHSSSNSLLILLVISCVFCILVFRYYDDHPSPPTTSSPPSPSPSPSSSPPLEETAITDRTAAVDDKPSTAECGCSGDSQTLTEFMRSTEIVDDCQCDYQTVDALNVEFRPILLELLNTPFFNFFQVNLNRPCLFWEDNSLCFQESCSVQECPENEIPEIWRKSKSADHDPLGALTHTSKGLPHFQSCGHSDKDFCVQDSADDEDAVFIKLSDNPERFTGYSGESTWRIWRAIYTENCFSDSESQTCSEKRIFYRIISGFHASIGAHLAEKYYDSATNQWIFNVALFGERVGNHPDRIKNLYFTYLLVFRALTKASNYLLHYEFSTGMPELDFKTVELIRQIAMFTKKHPNTFDEQLVFQDENADLLKEEFKVKFRNISQIMDCVSCEKCKVWGKIQVLGLGTALKILFSYNHDTELTPIDYQLSRNEVIALVNVFGRLSDSIRAFCEYKLIIEDQRKRWEL